MDNYDFGINPFLKVFITALASDAIAERDKQKFETISNLILTTVKDNNITDGIDYEQALERLKLKFFKEDLNEI